MRVPPWRTHGEQSSPFFHSTPRWWFSVLPGHQQPLGTYQKRRFSGSAWTFESPTSPHVDSSASSDLENHRSRMDSPRLPTLFHPLFFPPPPSFSLPWEQLHFILATAGSESHHWVSEQPQECPCCHTFSQPPPPTPQSLLCLPGLPRLSPEEEEVMDSGLVAVPEPCTRAPASSSRAWAGPPAPRLCLHCS